MAFPEHTAVGHLVELGLERLEDGPGFVVALRGQHCRSGAEGTLPSRNYSSSGSQNRIPNSGTRSRSSMFRRLRDEKKAEELGRRCRFSIYQQRRKELADIFKETWR